MQKVKSQKPDIVMFMATAITESQMCLMKKKELGLEMPFICNGGWACDPSYLQAGADTLEGMITICPTFPNKATPPEWIKYSLEQCKKDYSDEPWMGQELGWAWSMVPIMAEVLELAQSRDRNKIREAGSKLDIHDVMATRYLVKQGIAFDENGRIAKKYQGVLLVQWQNGKPVCVYPEELALAKPMWVVK
jgi:branched-chain amino acid transport system substrate-binding protein